MYESLIDQAKQDAQNNGWLYMGYKIEEDCIVVTFKVNGREFQERYC